MKKLVYVTGAGRGIGRAIALKLAKAGFIVTGCARTLTELEQTRSQSNNQIRIAKVDVTDLAQLESWFKGEEKETEATPWGLVTAAGIYGAIGPFVESSWEEWRRGIEVNLYGTAMAVKVFSATFSSHTVRGESCSFPAEGRLNHFLVSAAIARQRARSSVSARPSLTS